MRGYTRNLYQSCGYYKSGIIIIQEEDINRFQITKKIFLLQSYLNHSLLTLCSKLLYIHQVKAGNENSLIKLR